MPHFSETSKRRITTLHPDLRRVLQQAIKVIDFTVLDGLRTEAKQAEAVAKKRSNAPYPKSRHNRSKNADGTYDYELSDAVDIAPYPVRWPDISKQTAKEYVKRMGRFYLLAGVIITLAATLDVKLRWGGHFKSFFDGPHFERIAE